MCLVELYMWGLVALKLLYFPQETNPHDTRLITLTNQLSHVLSVMFKFHPHGISLDGGQNR